MTVFVIAEAGSSHVGELGNAVSLVEAAAQAGATAVKFQMFRADSMYPPGPLREASRRWELPESWLPIMKHYADASCIEFMCSAFSKDTVDMVDPFVARHKIASLESLDDDLVAHIVSKGKPIIMSTGAASREDMRHHEWGPLGMPYARHVPTTLLHCMAAYPAPLEEANMRVLYHHDEMGRDCDGLSDHSTHPTLLPVMAVALGATTIEKHLRLDTTPLDAPDYPHSLTPSQFREMVDAIRMAEGAMGDGIKRVMPSEESLVRLKRRSGKLRGEL